jgi:hypothetical protein
VDPISGFDTLGESVILRRSIKSSREGHVMLAISKAAIGRSMVLRRAAFRRTVISRAALWAVICGALAASLGCGGAQKPPPESSASVTETAPDPAIGEAPECVDDKEQRVTCLADGDCCSGFVCGKDPDLNQAVNYCIYGG